MEEKGTQKESIPEGDTRETWVDWTYRMKEK